MKRTAYGRLHLGGRTAGALLLGALALPATLRAQAQGGVGGPSMASDTVPLTRTITDQEVMQEDMSRARLRLGPMRILPSVAVENAGYDSNVFGTSENVVGDWTFTLRAGARFLIPFGPKIVLRADAFPRYTWYNELSDRDQFGGNYNGSLYGFFNRMSVEIGGGYNQSYQQYSSEIDTQVLQTATTATVKLEVELTSHFSLFGQAAWEDVNYDQIQGPPVQDIGVPLNDRTDTGGRGGVRYTMSDSLSLGLAGEATFSDFKLTPEFRNNESDAVLASIGFNRPAFYINLVGGWRDGKGRDDNFFPDYSTGVGSFFVSWFPIRWLELQGFGHRSVTYSITLLSPYYFENRLGGKINVQVGSRVLLTGFGLTGPNNYPRPQPIAGGDLVTRRDENEQYGGGVSVLLWRPLVFTGRVDRTVVNSNIPGDSRAYTRFTMFLSFSGVFTR